MDEQDLGPIKSEIGSEESGYLVQFKEDGVYLTVYPYTDDRILFELTDITKILQENGITEYGIETLAKTIREGTGEPVKIVNELESGEDEEEPVDPEIKIYVSKDRMKVTLSISSPKNARKPMIHMIMEKLNQNNIVFGLKESALKTALNYTDGEIVVAEGKPPVHGENASIRFAVDFSSQGRPEAMEFGRVDFKNLNLFIVVNEDDLLAERTPQTPGIPGMDVYGVPVAAKPGKTTMLPAGKNTRIVDEHKLVAALSGQAVLSGGKISVSPSIEIKNDVDFSTGNVEFNGSVVVRGSVQAGFSIKAEGDVEVYGTISGGTVEARNITVRAGIQGMQRGCISAREDIRTSFAENARLIAGRDAIITEAVLHSEVSAGKRVIVQGRRGVIAGGSTSAGEEILAKIAGNAMDTATKLEVGINPMLREEYTKTRKLLTKADEALDQTQKALNLLKAIKPECLSEARKEMLLRLTKSQFPLAAEVKQYKDRIAEIECAFEELKEGKIRISDVVYPGVKIIVGSAMKHIRSKMQHSTFYAEDGEVKVGPY